MEVGHFVEDGSVTLLERALEKFSNVELSLSLWEKRWEECFPCVGLMVPVLLIVLVVQFHRGFYIVQRFLNRKRQHIKP